MQKIYWIERNRLWLAVKNFPLPLLMLCPFFTLSRWAWNFLAAILRQGSAGNFRQQSSVWDLMRTVVRAYGDGLRQLGTMRQKRKQIRRSRKITDLDFYRLLFRFRISGRVLAFHDWDHGVLLNHAKDDSFR
jgi:hypothetical protein